MPLKRKFREFVEGQQAKSGLGDATGESPLTSRFSLGDGNDLPPFVVSDDTNSEHFGKNKNLAPLVRAFKKSANWGWSKDPKSGEDKPVKVGSKKLFLTGGAVRDHLTGRRPKHMELVTDASPDEVYHILTQNKFKFIGEDGKPDNGPSAMMQAGGDQPAAMQVFWVKKKDGGGRPYSFGVKIRNDEFDLSVFTRNKDGDISNGTHADDAAGRDFTINSMYLNLSNDNGPNKELSDFFGGLHHLKSGRINPIGGFENKFREDPMRILRFARMMARYGDPTTVSDEETDMIRKAAPLMAKLDRKGMMDEFQKGMGYEDIDPRKFLKLLSVLGVTDHLFPPSLEGGLDMEMPGGLREIGDRHAPIAWMMRGLPESVIAQHLDGMRNEDKNKILVLVKTLRLSPEVDANTLAEMTDAIMSSGVPTRKIRAWLTKVGGKPDSLADAFVAYLNSPRVEPINGNGEVTDAFMSLKDPFSGQLRTEDATQKKRELELYMFRKCLALTA
jgi:hypothetical protein